MKIVETTVEIEGKNYLCQKRSREENLSGQPVDYSFDREKTWHPTMIEAFMAAKQSEQLVVVGEDLQGAGEFETFMLGLITEIQSLKPGEGLRIVRDSVAVTVTKEQAVLAARASAIKEVDLRMEGAE